MPLYVCMLKRARLDMLHVKPSISLQVHAFAPRPRPRHGRAVRRLFLPVPSGALGRPAADDEAPALDITSRGRAGGLVPQVAGVLALGGARLGEVRPAVGVELAGEHVGRLGRQHAASRRVAVREQQAPQRAEAAQLRVGASVGREARAVVGLGELVYVVQSEGQLRRSIRLGSLERKWDMDSHRLGHARWHCLWIDSRPRGRPSRHRTWPLV